MIKSCQHLVKKDKNRTYRSCFSLWHHFDVIVVVVGGGDDDDDDDGNDFYHCYHFRDLMAK